VGLSYILEYRQQLDNTVNCETEEEIFVDQPLQCLEQRLFELPAYWENGYFENEIRRFLP